MMPVMCVIYSKFVMWHNRVQIHDSKALLAQVTWAQMRLDLVPSEVDPSGIWDQMVLGTNDILPKYFNILVPFVQLQTKARLLNNIL